MRIIAGQARSIPLAVPDGLAVRPTADRAREALFNSLGEFSDLTVWDLYAGCGALGLESASRGAKKVVFVEQNSEHCNFIQRNVDKVKTAVKDVQTTVLNRSVSEVSWGGDADLIFADPPYPDSLNEFASLLKNNGFIKFASKSKLIWEVPNGNGMLGEFLKIAPRRRIVRRFGSVDFLIVNFLEESV